ncbi:hypothetical protein [Nitratireductor thuwali]|uniref:Uncharacterized protein n=1 Tax=Nitratireductor thuwali TaxID=2267699 RepID=A0ABY5MLF1_9HYPH|nr:hypothetical protein NTH_02737 [Nitratireductor thuwali]
MLPENITAILARNETWSGQVATEPYEAGWAREAVIFVRALKEPVGPAPTAQVEISPDGMHWVPEGAQFTMPAANGEIAVARLTNFGNWLRIATRFEDGASCTVLVTLHLKA